MKYRKKQEPIEAFQYDGDLKGSDGNYYVPDWAVKAFEDGILFYGNEENDQKPWELFVYVLEISQPIHVEVGDYLMLVNGMAYPRSKNLFEMLYEPVR